MPRCGSSNIVSGAPASPARPRRRAPSACRARAHRRASCGGEPEAIDEAVGVRRGPSCGRRLPTRLEHGIGPSIDPIEVAALADEADLGAPRAGARTGRAPPMRIAPDVGRGTPPSADSSVDLPAPLRPSRPQMVPPAIENETSSTARVSPKWTLRSTTSSVAWRHRRVGWPSLGGLVRSEGADGARPRRRWDAEALRPRRGPGRARSSKNRARRSARSRSRGAGVDEHADAAPLVEEALVDEAPGRPWPPWPG